MNQPDLNQIESQMEQNPAELGPEEIVDQKAVQRNKVANQCFFLLFFVLMLDGLLYTIGVRWLPYPASNLVLISLCMIYYLLRISFQSTATPARTRVQGPVIILALFIVLAGVSGWVISLQKVANEALAFVGQMLMIAAAVCLFFLLLLLVVQLVTERRRKK